MVPRPEDQKPSPGRRAAADPGEIYSNSSDDDCAKLVKVGQLDTFRYVLGTPKLEKNFNMHFT